MPRHVTGLWHSELPWVDQAMNDINYNLNCSCNPEDRGPRGPALRTTAPTQDGLCALLRRRPQATVGARGTKWDSVSSYVSSMQVAGHACSAVLYSM